MGMMVRRNRLLREQAKKAASEPKKEEPAKVEPEKVEEVKDEGVEWTAEEINKMPFMKLKSVAKKNGVDVTDKEASAIRSELIEKLGL